MTQKPSWRLFAPKRNTRVKLLPLFSLILTPDKLTANITLLSDKSAKQITVGVLTDNVVYIPIR